MDSGVEILIIREATGCMIRIGIYDVGGSSGRYINLARSLCKAMEGLSATIVIGK
jgi:glycerol uptake facilitator-like aquaporin